MRGRLALVEKDRAGAVRKAARAEALGDAHGVAPGEARHAKARVLARARTCLGVYGAWHATSRPLGSFPFTVFCRAGARTAHRIACRAAHAHGLHQPSQADVGKRVRAHHLAHLVHAATRRDQLVLDRRVHAVEARPRGGRADNAQVHLGRARVAQHLHKLAGGVAAHDAVVDDHEAPTLDGRAHGVQLQAYAHLAQLLRGLDEGAAHVAVLHYALGVRDAALARKADGARDAAVGHAYAYVGIGRRLGGQHAPHPHARLIHRCAVEDAVWAREVDLLEDARRRTSRGDALLAHETLAVQAHYFARSHVAHVACAGDVQTAGLAGHAPAAVGHAPYAQRAYAVRVAKRVERLAGDEDHRVGALDHLHRVLDALAYVVGLLGVVADQLGRHLAVGGAAKRDAALNQLDAQMRGVHQRAVVRHGHDFLADGG